MNTTFFDFDGAAVGSVPAGLTTFAAALKVVVDNAISGSNAFGEASPAGSDDTVLYTGQSAVDQDVRFDFTAIGTTGSFGDYNTPGVVLRSTAGYTDAYLLVFDNAGSVNLFKRVASSYGAISAQGNALGSLTAGSRYSVRAGVSGSTITIKLWGYGTTEPGPPQASFTDSTFDGVSGHPGIRFGGAGTTAAISLDNLYFGNAGAVFAGGLIAPTLSSGVVGSTSAALSWTASSQSPGTLAYQLKRSPHGAGTYANVSGATTSPASDTGLAASTSYDYRVTSSDGVNAPVDSNVVNVVTSAGATPTIDSATPATTPASHLGTSIALAGTLTAWTSGTSFAVSGVAGCRLLSATVASATAATLRLIPGTASGTLTISDGSRSIGVAVTGSADNFFAPTDAGFAFYGRWDRQPGGATSINSGSTLEFGFTGDACYLGFDTFGVVYPPEVLIELDGQWLPRVTSLATAPTVTLSPTYTTATAVKAHAHRVKLWLEGVYEGVDSGGPQATVNQWSSRAAAAKFLGVALPPGESLLPASIDPNQVEFLGDSITATVRAVYTGSGASNQAVMASHLGFAQVAADRLGLKPVVSGLGGQGITTAGSAGVPAFATAFPLIYSGASYAPAHEPAVVILYHGTNDKGSTAGPYQSAYQSALALVRAAYPAALIFAVVPHGCTTFTTGGGTFTSATSGAVAALADPHVFLLDYSAGVIDPTTDRSDTVAHLNPGGHARLGARLAADVQAQATASGIRYQATTTTVTVNKTTRSVRTSRGR